MQYEGRVCTGLAGLDSQLGGGVPPGTSILLIAESTNALYQFLNEIAGYGLAHGEDVLWFELDRPWGLFKQAVSGFATPSTKGHLKVLHAYEPRIGEVSGNGTGAEVTEITPEEVSKRLAESIAAVEPGRYRLIFTSLSALLQNEPIRDVLALLRQAVALNHELGGLQVFTLVQDAHPPADVALLKHTCTAVFELGLERKGFGLYSYLKVEKLLGIADSSRLMLFNETDQGLRMESTRRVH